MPGAAVTVGRAGTVYGYADALVREKNVATQAEAVLVVDAMAEYLGADGG